MSTVPTRKRSLFRRPGPYAAVILAALILGGVYAVTAAREVGRRTSCLCNAHVIALALVSYHNTYGTFPPAYIADKDGRPIHSWRVLILPYIGQEELYARYRFDEPWDGPNNLKLLDEIPPAFKCPSHSPAATHIASLSTFLGPLACSTPATVSSAAKRQCTNYAAVLGPHCVFRGAKPVSEQEISDGFGQTLTFGEVTDADILWTRPEDIDIAKHPKIGDRIGFSSDHPAGVVFAFADGRAKVLSINTPQATIDALYTRDGGERMSDNDF